MGKAENLHGRGRDGLPGCLARRVGVVVLAAGLASGALAATPALAVAEMDSLLAKLGSSGCRFQRNGSWYDAATAVDHLRKKRAWLEKHDKIRRTEDFIRLGASESSMSGKPYAVKCPDRVEVASKVWLESQLARLRAAKAP